MEINIIKPSILIRNYLLNDIANYDNKNGLSPKFIITCQEKIKHQINNLKQENYNLYKDIISFLYLDHLHLQILNNKLSKPKNYITPLDDIDMDLDMLLDLITWDNTIIDILINPLIAMYGIVKSKVKIPFNDEIERKWNPYYKLEKMAYYYENSDYEIIKSIIYTNFFEKGPSIALKEINNLKQENPSYYRNYIIEILRNFFIYNFVTLKDPELLSQLKNAIIKNTNLISFYEQLNFVERMRILIIYLEFNYNYTKENMTIRNTFAKEEEYAKPYIKALTL